MKREKRKDGVEISTIKPLCLAWYGKYETAAVYEDGVIDVLEGYGTEKEALKGHKKYMKMTSDELKKVQPLG